MDRYDLRADLIRALKAKGKKVNERAKPIRFQCIRHDDTEPSAWIGDGAWGCFACNFQESQNTLADELGVERPRGGFTVEEYASRKGFTLDRLRQWGVQTTTGRYGDDVVTIPYHDAEGKLLRSKHRTRSGKTPWASDGQGVHLYGLDILAKAKPTTPVILVEGESDCHAAWHHNILALGVPGATMWRSDWAKHLKGRTVFIWQEPGEGGVQMVNKIGADFPDARVMHGNGVKDLADLFRDTGAGFKEAVKLRMAAALPIGKDEPKIPFDAVVGGTLDGLLVEKLKPIDSVPTPIPSWNSRCRDAGGGRGLARGWHITVGANTGNGKSLLALNLAAEAIRHGERVGFVSLEMSQIQLVTRLLAIVSGLPVRKLEQGDYFDTATWRDAGRVVQEIYDRTGGVVYVNRAPLVKLSDVTDCMRQQYEVNGCRYMIVDYLQLAWTGKARNIFEAVQEVSHAIRSTARELNVISVGLSQFNRETSNNRESPPTPQGLMGGSPLENDSDQVLLLDHSQVTRDKLMDTSRTALLLAKNRHGGATEIPVEWNYRTLTLRELPSTINTVLPDPEPMSDRGEAWEDPRGAIGDLSLLPGAA